MLLRRRKNPIKMRLIPYGGGWTDVYVDFGDGELYFVISSVFGDSFGTLMRALYFLCPGYRDPEEAGELVEYGYGQCEIRGGVQCITKIVDSVNENRKEWIEIPWRAAFAWDDELSNARWTLERQADENGAFMLKIGIVREYEEEETHISYTVRYVDFCYAVADACTKAIKKHGFLGYHHATYTEDMNLRYLLFLKAVALGSMDAVRITWYPEKDKGETSDFRKEMKLLLFDM